MSTQLQSAQGLIPLVKQPTRGDNILDMLFVSEPCYPGIKIITSAIKSDHKAIVAVSDRPITNLNKQSVRVSFRKRSPEQHARLLSSLSELDEKTITSIADPHQAWDAFYNEAVNRLNQHYPVRQITMTSSDLDFMSSEIKFMLRNKNKLMSAGRVEEANALAIKVKDAITKANAVELKNIDVRHGLKDLWDKLTNLQKEKYLPAAPPPTRHWI